MNNGNSPAMPQYAYGTITATSKDFGGEGLTKREYFAGLAMQGFLAKYGNDEHDDETCAKYSAWMADALLAELEKDNDR